MKIKTIAFVLAASLPATAVFSEEPFAAGDSLAQLRPLSAVNFADIENALQPDAAGLMLIKSENSRPSQSAAPARQAPIRSTPPAARAPSSVRTNHTEERRAPAIERKAPVVERKAPVIERKAPVIERKAPVIERKTTVEPKVKLPEPPARVDHREKTTPPGLPASKVPQHRPDSIPGGNLPAQKRPAVVSREPIVRPHATGTRETRANGGTTERIKHDDGTHETISTRVNPRTHAVSTTRFVTKPDGTKLTHHASGVMTERRKNGDVISKRADKSRVTTISRSTSWSGSQVYVRKTTVVNGRTVVVNRTYNGYYHGSRYYYRYAPAYHPWWGPAWYPFYYSPWATPYYYPWGWYPIGYYSWYYTPYPYYPSAAFWLTDFIIRDAIMVNHDNAVRAEQRAVDEARQAAISEETKRQIKAQVEKALADYKDRKEPELATALNPRQIFVVHDEISAVVIGEEGAEPEQCDLSSGDLVKLAAQPEADAVSARMTVVSAKGSCEPGSQVNISMTDLQEMLNEFTHRLEKGVAKMKDEKEAGTLSTSGGTSTVIP